MNSNQKRSNMGPNIFWGWGGGLGEGKKKEIKEKVMINIGYQEYSQRKQQEGLLSFPLSQSN